MKLTSKPTIKLSIIVEALDKRLRPGFMEIFYDYEQAFGSDVYLGTDHFIKLAGRSYIISCLNTLHEESKRDNDRRAPNERDVCKLISHTKKLVMTCIPKHALIEVDTDGYN